jgi:hypothetical protein
MTATRYPDMVCFEPGPRPMPDKDVHPRGRYFPDAPTCAKELDECADWEYGAIVRMTHEGFTAVEIGEELGMTPMKVSMLQASMQGWLGKRATENVSDSAGGKAWSREDG